MSTPLSSLRSCLQDELNSGAYFLAFSSASVHATDNTEIDDADEPLSGLMRDFNQL